MSNFDHIFLYLLLFLFYYFWGKYYSHSKDNFNFWILAIVPILLYVFVVGSRYGWGNDYIYYKYRMEHALTYPEEQVGFRWLNQAILWMELDYVGGYMVYSLIFIVCAFVLMQSYKDESSYMYAFVIPATLLFVNFAIRQGVALGFVLLAIYFLNKKKWFGVILSIFIASSIHYSILITVAIIGINYLFFKKPINWKITIPLYLFFTFFYDIKQTAIVSKYIQYISLDNNFQRYIDKTDLWFGVEAIGEHFEQSLSAKIISSIFYIAIIFLGYYALKSKPNSRIVYIYNSTTIGIILLRIVYQFEILRRIVQPWVILYFIPLGYIIYVFINIQKNKTYFIENKSYNYIKRLLPLYKVGLFCILFYFLLYWGRFIFMSPNYLFFWNI